MAATRPSPSESFSISVLPDRREVVVVPHGDLDLTCADALEQEVQELRAARFGEIVIDLRRLTFMDSSGLHALLALRTDARRDGHGLTLIPGPAEVQLVFELTATRSAFTWRDY